MELPHVNSIIVMMNCNWYPTASQNTEKQRQMDGWMDGWMDVTLAQAKDLGSRDSIES